MAALLAACGPSGPPQKEAETAPEVPADRLVLEAASFADLPGWPEDDLTGAAAAFRRSCGRFGAQPDDRSVGPEGLAGTVADWRGPCAAIENAEPGDLQALFEDWFQPFAASNNGETEGLFTGYYEAELKGSRTPQGPESVPLYRPPSDMVKVNLGQFRADLKGTHLVGRLQEGRLVPYLTRAEIDGGALDGQDLELIWAEDGVAAFFLHVQGSGRVVLPDGSHVRVGYAANNGHEFYAIGRALIEEGHISPAKKSRCRKSAIGCALIRNGPRN